MYAHCSTSLLFPSAKFAIILRDPSVSQSAGSPRPQHCHDSTESCRSPVLEPFTGSAFWKIFFSSCSCCPRFGSEFFGLAVGLLFFFSVFSSTSNRVHDLHCASIGNFRNSSAHHSVEALVLHTSCTPSSASHCSESVSRLHQLCRLFIPSKGRLRPVNLDEELTHRSVLPEPPWLSWFLRPCSPLHLNPSFHNFLRIFSQICCICQIVPHLDRHCHFPGALLPRTFCSPCLLLSSVLLSSFHIILTLNLPEHLYLSFCPSYLLQRKFLTLFHFFLILFPL